MNRILRLSSLILTLVVTLGLVATTTAPAQAQPRSTGAPRVAEHVAVASPADDDTVINPGPQELASSWCGNWWRGPMWCVNFNRSEQKWLSGITSRCGDDGDLCRVPRLRVHRCGQRRLRHAALRG